MRNHLLIGCGYLGSRVVSVWQQAGHSITLLTRSPDRAEAFRAQGFAAVVGDVTQPASLRALAASQVPFDSVVYCVGYDSRAGHSIDEVYAEGLQNLLTALEGVSPPTFVYTSSTGVYGDSGGGVVDETTPPLPTRPGGIASLSAERVLQRSRFAGSAVILRLAGIYGPGRLPYLESLQRGEPMEASESGYLNLIHVDDAAAIIAQFTERRFSREGLELYCVSDGRPVKRGDFYREIARQLGAPEPRFAKAESGARTQRARTSKRIDSRRLWERIGRKPFFPSYVEGIAHIVATHSP